jgi:hypothetical protein
MDEVGKRILEDKTLLYKTTPSDIQASIPHVAIAISHFEKKLFENLGQNGSKLTKDGHILKQKAEDRKAKEIAKKRAAENLAAAAAAAALAYGYPSSQAEGDEEEDAEEDEEEDEEGDEEGDEEEEDENDEVYLGFL